MSHGAFCHIGVRQNVTFGAGLRVPILFSEVEMTCRKWLKNKLFRGILEEKITKFAKLARFLQHKKVRTAPK